MASAAFVVVVAGIVAEHGVSGLFMGVIAVPGFIAVPGSEVTALADGSLTEAATPLPDAEPLSLAEPLTRSTYESPNPEPIGIAEPRTRTPEPC